MRKNFWLGLGLLGTLCFLSYFAGRAIGSGGMYSQTEHGGNDVNLNSTTGVYRASVDTVNHPAARGECVHCHEQHGSVEGTEPLPTGGPSDYLLMRTNDNNLCYECHTSSLNRSWQGSATYNLSGHGTTSETNPNPSDGRPANLCVQCHNPHGAKDEYIQLPNPQYPKSMTKYVEEKTCFSQSSTNDPGTGIGCHGSTYTIGTAKNIYSQFQKSYKHPLSPALDATRGKTKKHDSMESQSFQSGVFDTDRHVECVDCHNPHMARNYGVGGNSTHTPPTNVASRALLGAWGVEPTYTIGPTEGWKVPVSYSLREFTTLDDTNNKEYQLCFKCHSSFAKVTWSSPYTDQSIEFNPNNKSFHPVYQAYNIAPLHTNSYTTPSANNGNIQTMAAPFNTTSPKTMYCSDCHGSETDTDPEGPHGSTNQYIIVRSTSATDNTLCLKCHLSTVYSPASNPGSGTETGSRFDQQTSGNNSANHYNHVTSRGKFCRDCHAGTQTAPTGNSPVPLAPGSAHGTNLVTGFINGVNINSYTPGNCDPACHGSQTFTAGVE